MEALFRKLLANNFSDLAGLRLDASIPVTESLLNEFLAALLEGNNTIQAAQVFVHADNRLSADLKTALLPWALHLKLKLDRSVDLSSFGSPKLRLWLENHRWLAGLGALFKALPGWARLYGSQVVIDLGAFLPAPEHKRLVDLVDSVEIETQPGRAIFHIKTAIE